MLSNYEWHWLQWRLSQPNCTFSHSGRRRGMTLDLDVLTEGRLVRLHVGHTFSACAIWTCRAAWWMQQAAQAASASLCGTRLLRWSARRQPLTLEPLSLLISPAAPARGASGMLLLLPLLWGQNLLSTPMVSSFSKDHSKCSFDRRNWSLRPKRAVNNVLNCISVLVRPSLFCIVNCR